MKRLGAWTLAIGGLCVTAGAQAALVGRDINGNALANNAASSVFLYDTVLNVTWLRDANYALTSGFATSLSFGDGVLPWSWANGWATDLSVGKYSGWRLPTFKPANGIAYDFTTLSSDGSTDIGGPPPNGWGTANELGHLFSSGDLGLFENLQNYFYWTGVSALPQGDYAIAMSVVDGAQTGATSFAYSLVVRDGDVAAVPLPAAAWLMLSGIGALGVAARRRKAA